MKLDLIFIFSFSFFVISADEFGEKYHSIRQQCQINPNHSICQQLKTKFLPLIQKCQTIQTKQQTQICQEVKLKFCSIFPSICLKSTRKTTKKSSIHSMSSTLSTKKTLDLIRTSSSLTNSSVKPTTKANVEDEKEFIEVPIDPEVLRTRGEYCIRNGKDKKCQLLLNNLKTTYSTCKTKPNQIQEKQIDCHSFQTHLCQAFPKFPPCLKKST